MEMIITNNQSANSAIRNLVNDEHYTDVTLLSSDDMEINAHKAILGSSSEFFQNIFLKKRHQNLVIYMKGMSYEYLKLVMEFIYVGECQLHQDKVEQFMMCIMDLKLQGLMADQEEEEDTVMEQTFNESYDQSKDNDLEIEVPFSPVVGITEEEEMSVKLEAEEFPSDEYGFEDFNDVPDSLTTKQQFEQQFLYDEERRLCCLQCKYKTKIKSHLKFHIRSVHEGLTFDCHLCDYKNKKRNILKEHILAAHGGRRLRCQYCNYETDFKDSLKQHFKAKHSKLEKHRSPPPFAEVQVESNQVQAAAISLIQE